jgi:hypothetical protein
MEELGKLYFFIEKYIVFAMPLKAPFPYMWSPHKIPLNSHFEIFFFTMIAYFSLVNGTL